MQTSQKVLWLSFRVCALILKLFVTLIVSMFSKQFTMKIRPGDIGTGENRFLSPYLITTSWHSTSMDKLSSRKRVTQLGLPR